MPKHSPTRYRTTNWSEYNAALRQRGSLSVWFDPDTVWHAEKTGKRGRPDTFSDAAVQVCLTLKVLFGLPLRQTVGLVESLIRMAGLDWPVPDYSTLCRRQARIGVQIPYRRSGKPLNLLVDSTGIKFRGDGEWLARKHGPSRRRQWRKVHIAMDTQTGDIRAVEFTSSRHGDSPLLPDLLSQIPEEEEIATVTADGAYDTRRCHTAIIEHGADAVIPIRRNGRAWKEDCPAALARNEILRATRHLGRALWKKWAGYHVRSRVEAQMNCLKLFGERIMSRDPDRQTAEIQIRIAIMNRFSALGRAEIEAVA
ncbi:IS5 family transposase [Thioclava nitratireducens]|uniref:IS5 family transposase n=1 Tax=Thioclava nitratireducens TaxID=1915078 RepID=UPI00247FFCCE|nr:IS5 family transposase [Thioclava nitratireducens]WGT51374.1 IS5 family transposase [Thioclava nitratireducens]WGT51460.1 IS5 family transposase [Thioclava nitratireducens]